MSPSSPAWTVIGAVARRCGRGLLVRQARQGDPASRWLAVATVAWGAAFLAQGAEAGAITPAVIQLTLTDLLALLGLPAVVIALFRLARPDDGIAGSAQPEQARWPISTGQILDGCLLGLAVFCVGWITLLRSAYAAADVGAGTFTVDLIHPAADVITLGGGLGLAVLAGRRALAPYLALCAATVGDFLAVHARVGGSHPAVPAQLAWLAAICLLGLSAVLPGKTATRPAADAPGRPLWPLATLIALGCAGVAGVVTLIFAIVTWGRSGPVPLLAGAALILTLAARIAGLLRQASAMSALAAQTGGQFQQLADRTSDAVLLCDAAGRVSYASKAVAHYGYTPERLAGARLTELVHPDDLPHVLHAALQVHASQSAPVGNLACRVRSSDGTWRHVQATLSRYSQLGRQDLLLVTARDVSDQVALRRQVTHLTFHDGLTGLPNRSYLEERAKDLLARNREATEPPAQTGAIFVDLDGFTAINDSVGHGAGDLVLAQAARRLRGLVPAHDTVARWGGDEFAVLVEGAASPQEIVDVAERMAGAIEAEPFQVAGRDISITASVGVAFADPEVAEHLLRNADLAMSRAKDAGGGRVEVFAAHMHADVIRRLELATDLRAAIEQGSLGIEYQPVVELSTSRVASVEALVRWTHDGEPIKPAEFLGIAEDSGLIVPLGQPGCSARRAGRSPSGGQSGWQVGLSVNFSLRQVSAAGFAETVLTTLDDSGLSSVSADA